MLSWPLLLQFCASLNFKILTLILTAIIFRILTWRMKVMQFTEAKRIKVISLCLLFDLGLWQSCFRTEQKSLNSQGNILRPVFSSLQNFGCGCLVISLAIYQIIWPVSIPNISQLCLRVCKFHVYRQIRVVNYVYVFVNSVCIDKYVI